MEEIYKNGPNQIKYSAGAYSTTDAKKTVNIRIEAEGMAAKSPISIPKLLKEIASQYPDQNALAFKTSKGSWEFVNYKDYLKKVIHISKAFIKLGLEARNSVGILSSNCPEWVYSELGAIHAGAMFAGIYPSSSSEAIYHILNTSSANIVIVDDTKQMEKVRNIKNSLPLLKAVIQIYEPFEAYINNENGYFKWSYIEEMDTEDVDIEFNERMKNMAINECCCLVYTSGTVGQPKAVMLSHDNVLWAVQSLSERFVQSEYTKEVLVSYLPMNHIAAQILDVFYPIFSSALVYFADRDALKGTLLRTLQQARPTRFMGVPRILEKIIEGLRKNENQIIGFRKTVLDWAKSVALRHHLAVMDGKCNESWEYTIAKKLVLNRIKAQMGLDRCKTFASGAAPINEDTKKDFLCIDIQTLEGYGLSECSGAHCLSTHSVPNLKTVGKPLRGIHTKIINQDENGNGEICQKGRSIFMGYLNDIEQTNAALDDDGWLHSGDIGYIDENGYVYVTGRIKELIITSGGENIPPNNIENLVKRELPGISNAFLIGDKRKYLTMLVTIKTEINTETGEPKEILNSDALEWMESLGLPYKTITEIIDAGPCPKVKQSIQEGIDRANMNAISNAQRVQKFAILKHDFSVATGELTITLKVKRAVVEKMYNETIEELYK